MSYDIKAVAKGAKRKVTISLNGKVIGSRTSARPYRFALVVKRSQPYALKSTKEALAYHIKQEAKYRAIADDAPGARAAAIAAERQAFHRAGVEKFIAEGEYAKWAGSEAKQIERLRAEIPRLESGPQPEFDEPFVLSWHSRADTVPAVKEYHVQVAILPIPAEVA